MNLSPPSVAQPAAGELLPGLSVVIPCYRSEESLPPLCDRLVRVLDALGGDYEIILVNDGSPDRTGAVIDTIAGRIPAVRGVHLMRNYGQHSALLCGVRQARFAITVTMDDDLQHPPEELPSLVAALTDELDVVYGTPEKERHGLFRNLASRMTKLTLQSAMGAETALQVSALRVFRTELRAAFETYRSSFVSMDVLLTWGTRRFLAVPVRRDKRTIGTSNYTLGKLITHALNMMTGFSTLPLQIASLIGFTLTLFGMLVLAFVVGRYLLDGSSPPGFSFLACIIAIFSGAQLLCLGIIGEYLGRAHFRLLDRPSYVVRRAANPASARSGEESALRAAGDSK